ncbi:iron uptake porin [Gloeothece verrucosa]|uniref:Carbohydrate-selective porin OprB n=1 Tax=Gloeothece verrucosa (strain PCC 7822) TaxID=497965 RepID=E0ULN7_GLOV7|nr:iron uptake porin [Gloeothece verrucosa]ADN17867.1 Carbohydrate-selective porin OprB [Gloeothece verrucosa PCC 7822]
MLEIFGKIILTVSSLLMSVLTLASAVCSENSTQAETFLNFSSELEAAQTPAIPISQNDNSILKGLGSQVPRVNQLKDVSSRDWAYESLRSLAERYKCIVGYPNLTDRGNQTLTRWEFAVGLNICINNMESLIQENVAILREDIETLKRLAQEFDSELTGLKVRSDDLEARVAFFEDHQFSTTTKLQGEVVVALTDTFGNNDTTQTIFGDRIRLTFKTSFDGKDLLVTRLAAGNLRAFDTERNDAFIESPTTTQGFNVGYTGNNDIVIDWLAHFDSFKLNDKFKFNTYIPALGGIWPDNVPSSNPFFFNYDGGNGSLSTFANLSPIYRIGGGSGFVLNFNFNIVQLSGGYLAGQAGRAGNPVQGSGLFNGDYAALVQLNFQPIKTIELGITYVHGFHKRGNPIFGYGSRQPFVGTNAVNFAGAESDRVTNTYGFQAFWRIVDALSFTAFFAYGDLKQIGGFNSEYWTYAGGFALPDLGKEGNILGIFAGVQPYLGNKTLNTNNKNPVHVEVFYKYQLTDNINITPGAIWISNPEQVPSSNDEIIGTVRTTFAF